MIMVKKCFPNNMRNKAESLPSPLLLKTAPEFVTSETRPEKLIKGIRIAKEEAELWLFADDLTIYAEN